MHTHANKPAIKAYSRETFDDRALYAGFVGCRELRPQLGPFLYFFSRQRLADQKRLHSGLGDGGTAVLEAYFTSDSP